MKHTFRRIALILFGPLVLVFGPYFAGHLPYVKINGENYERKPWAEWRRLRTTPEHRVVYRDRYNSLWLSVDGAPENVRDPMIALHQTSDFSPPLDIWFVGLWNIFCAALVAFCVGGAGLGLGLFVKKGYELDVKAQQAERIRTEKIEQQGGAISVAEASGGEVSVSDDA